MSNLAEIKLAVREIKIARFMHYRDFLRHLYLIAKQKIRPYSYLKFSTDLGCGHNNSLRLVIVGKRPLTLKTADKIAKKLDLSAAEKRYWRALVQFNNTKSAGQREEQLAAMLRIKGRLLPDPIDQSRLEYFSEWYHPVIRELAVRSDFQMDPKWIQDKLIAPLRIEQIKRSLHLLSKLGLIYYDHKLGRFTCSKEQIDTGPDAKGIAFIGYQQRMLEQSKESISRVGKHRRELVSATLSLSESAIDTLKLKIHEIVKEAARLDEEDSSNDSNVVQFNVQLFPHTAE